MKSRMTNPRRSLHGAKYEQVSADLGENVHARCHGWKGTGFVWQPGMVREEIVFGDDECFLHVSICGASKGGYTASAGTDWRNQMWKGQCVPMATSSSGRLCCYPSIRKSRGTRRHASVNRNDAQTSKVWTIQMMMTLILTPALRVKTNTDWVSSRVVINAQWGVYWNCQHA